MIEQVEALLDRVEAFPPEQRDVTTELVQALLDMYGEGLARIVAADSVPVEDELVAHLLLLHGLHPVPVVRRDRRATQLAVLERRLALDRRALGEAHQPA